MDKQIRLDDFFKPVFKYYKQKAVKPSFENVVDFNNVSTLKNASLTYCTLNVVDFDIALGLKPFGHWKLYHCNDVPGLYFIPNPFTDEGKSVWINRCLKNYCCYPHKTNLDVQSDSLWDDTCTIINKFSEKDLFSNAGQLKVFKTCPIWKLRWATLGLHHDWNSKVYSRDEFSHFPPELNNLTKTFASSIGCKNYESQAAIVNYYHVGSTLSPHTDHSEEDLAKPLISISFGLPAIFLIGGIDKSTTPTAFFIRSGDVVIMSGSSRLAYHAVPRILESESDVCRTDPINIFKEHSRININVRQYQSLR